MRKGIIVYPHRVVGKCDETRVVWGEMIRVPRARIIVVRNIHYPWRRPMLYVGNGVVHIAGASHRKLFRLAERAGVAHLPHEAYDSWAARAQAALDARAAGKTPCE
jgi:hypothetical protein